MNALLLHLDGDLPNLALMRIAAHHRSLGDTVTLRQTRSIEELEPRFGDGVWDRVYASAIFAKTRPLLERVEALYPGAIIGGTGSYSLGKTLDDAGIPSAGPVDYTDYPDFQASIGFTMRGCRLACEFCVVPTKEGRPRSVSSVDRIWRGEPKPKHLELLDNDFFGNPEWSSIVDELRTGSFKVCFSQGINARMLSPKAARAIASLDYRAHDFKTKRIYTAWDNLDDERVLFRGLQNLVDAGVRPRHIMVYVLIGYWPGETHEQRDRRRLKLREFGALPYPMPYHRTQELLGFQRWVVGAFDKRIPWPAWKAAHYSPRRLGDRYSLTLFREESARG